MRAQTKLPNVKQVSLEELEARLQNFEAQYGMTSQQFYEQVQQALLEEKEEFVDWLDYYDVYRALKR